MQVCTDIYWSLHRGGNSVERALVITVVAGAISEMALNPEVGVLHLVLHCCHYLHTFHTVVYTWPLPLGVSSQSKPAFHFHFYADWLTAPRRESCELCHWPCLVLDPS